MGYFFDEEDESLEHHGILGQKWGVRRFEKASGGLTAAGKKRYETDEDGNYKKLPKKSQSSSTEENENKGLTDEQKEKFKKAAVIGAAVVGTTLAAYGGYKLHQLNKEATEGLSTRFHEAALNKFTEARANDSLSVVKGNDPGRIRNLERLAEAQRQNGRFLQEAAKNKNFSAKDKAQYLHNKRAAEKSAKKLIGVGKRPGFTDRQHESKIKKYNKTRERFDKDNESIINRYLDSKEVVRGLSGLANEDSHRIIENDYYRHRR